MTTYENGDPIITIMPISAFLDHRLTLIQTRVLAAIFSFRNKETGVASVKRETLSIRCGYSNRTISEATTHLCQLGWLVKTGKGGFSKASEFRITVPDLGTVPDSGTVPDPTSTTVPDPGTGNEQSNYKVITKKKGEQVACSISGSEMTEVPSDLALEFIAYRKAKKSPLTPTAWKGIQREAEKAGWSLTAAVEETMTRGWQSFKAEWVVQKKTGSAVSRNRNYVN